MRGTPRSFRLPSCVGASRLVVAAIALHVLWFTLTLSMTAAQAAPFSSEAVEEEKHGDADSSADGHDAHAEGQKSHDDGHGHHDELDLSHGNATAGLENPASWQFDTAIYTAVVFLIVLAVLFKFAWKPIMEGLERRERSIARTIEEAEKKLEQAAEHLRQYEAKLSAAAEEAKQIVERAHQSAESTAERIRQEAEEAARRERERAVAEIGLAKQQALSELADKVSESVFGVAHKVLEREVKPQDHQRLVAEALSKLPSEN